MTKTIAKWFLFLSVVLLCVVLVSALKRAEDPELAFPGYVLSVFDGRIAVFTGGKETVLQITDTRIASLPQTEAERLKRGIAASTEEELQSLIEDYCS